MTSDTNEIMTARLVLRCARVSDAAAMPAVFNDPDVERFTRSIPYPYGTAEAEEAIARFAAQQAAGEGTVRLITEKEGGGVVGSVGLAARGENAAELGYVVGRAWSGRGYATEAAAALLDHGFRVLGLDEIVAHAMIENPASSQVLRKIGMISLGVTCEVCGKRGVPIDVHGFRLDRGEFEHACTASD